MSLLVPKEHKALHTVALSVPTANISTAKIQKIIADMKKTLEQESDGVAIAAPQIGISFRIFVLSPKIFEGKEKNEPLVYINPTITKASKKMAWKEGEGCLSLRWLYGKVRRHTNVTVSAYDEFGNLFERGAGGLLAHIFQHEIDHLDGMLFIEKAKDIYDAPPEESSHEHK
jgi:peptide deformylase